MCFDVTSKDGGVSVVLEVSLRCLRLFASRLEMKHLCGSFATEGGEEKCGKANAHRQTTAEWHAVLEIRSTGGTFNEPRLSAIRVD